MAADKIGKLFRLPLKTVFDLEYKDFTPWLQQNIDVLNEVLDLNLVNVQREQTVGSFSVDLVAQDESSNGGTVVIENQMGKSDHDHLGKLITYLTALDAAAGIWIVSDPRPEHVGALNWLNGLGSARFYMVKAEAVRIGDSLPAPLFTLILGPSPEVAEAGTAKKEIAEQSGFRKRWWTQLIGRAAKVSKMHAHLTPGEWTRLGTSSGGFFWNYVVAQNECGVELYIDRGQDSTAENKAIFDQVFAHKDAIDKEFGAQLVWDRLDNARASAVRYTMHVGGYRSPEDQWPLIQDQQVEAMVKFEKALRPYLK